jgi:hypothetical protein
LQAGYTTRAAAIGVGNKPPQPPTLCSISRYTKVVFATKTDYTEKIGDQKAHARTRKEDGAQQKV